MMVLDKAKAFMTFEDLISIGTTHMGSSPEIIADLMILIHTHTHTHTHTCPVILIAINSHASPSG